MIHKLLRGFSRSVGVLFTSFFVKINLEFVSYEKFHTFGTMKTKQTENHPQAEPTKSELEILQVLWKHGPSTVRFVNDYLNEQKRAVQYTSTLKLMQIMTEKEMLLRDASSMRHIYRPAIEENQTKTILLDKFIDTMFNGSSTSLMMQLLGNKKTSQEEIDAIRTMLDQFDQK